MKVVPLVILTPSGNIKGRLHLPVNRSLRAFLSSDDELLKLTDVVLPGAKEAIPFFAIQKTAIILVIPAGEQWAEKNEADLMRIKPQVVSCLLAHGSIQGEFLLPEVIRFSDYLTLKKGFIELHQCHFGAHPFLTAEDLQRHPLPLALINVNNLVGITDRLEDQEFQP